MKKEKPAQQYGKPYTKKEFRQLGIGLIIAGVITALYGISVFQHGSENQMIQTKVGNEIYGMEPHNPLYILIAIAGGLSSISGVFMWVHGNKQN